MPSNLEGTNSFEMGCSAGPIGTIELNSGMYEATWGIKFSIGNVKNQDRKSS